MSNIDKQALREKFEAWWEVNYHNGNPPRFGWEHWRDGDGYQVDDDESELDGMWQSWQAAHSSKLEAAEKYAKDRDAENEGLSLTVGRLRVEKGAAEKTSTARLEALDRTHKMFQRERARADEAEKRIAELSHHLQCAHGFIEHTEAFGHEASNGILCCGDAQWNIDASRLALATAGKGEAS